MQRVACREAPQCCCASAHAVALVALASLLAAALLDRGAIRRARRRRPSGPRGPHRRIRGAALSLAGRSGERMAADRPQLSRSHRATTCGSAATAAPRWITAAASSASRATPICMCRGSTRTARAVHRAGPRDRARARARSGRLRAHRCAEFADPADAPRALSDRRRAGPPIDRTSPCAKAKRSSRSRTARSRRCRGRRRS